MNDIGNALTRIGCVLILLPITALICFWAATFFYVILSTP